MSILILQANGVNQMRYVKYFPLLYQENADKAVIVMYSLYCGSELSTNFPQI